MATSNSFLYQVGIKIKNSNIMKIKFNLIGILILGLLTTVISCKKEEAVQLATLTTSVITDITGKSAISGGDISNSGGGDIIARGIVWSTSPNPTTANNATNDGTGTGSFTSNLTGLTANTTYFVRAFATNSKGTAYGNEVSFTTTNIPNCGTVTDIDGNIYNTVTIGTQCWMLENLKTTKYRNGDPIQHVMDSTTLSSISTGAYCEYGFNSINSMVYGKMYNLFSIIDSRNIAPDGWHVPTQQDWETLITYLGGDDEAGGKLKEEGTSHWISPNYASNSSYFTALPGGGSYDIGTFGGKETLALFWSSTIVPGGTSEPEDHGYYILLQNNSNAVTTSGYGRGMCALSVRCVKD